MSESINGCFLQKFVTMTLFSWRRLAAAVPAAVYACSSYASSCCRAGRWCSHTGHTGTGIPGAWHACASVDRLNTQKDRVNTLI